MLKIASFHAVRALLGLTLMGLSFEACGSSETAPPACGPGTALSNGQCVIAAKCGNGTVLKEGQCVPESTGGHSGAGTSNQGGASSSGGAGSGGTAGGLSGDGGGGGQPGSQGGAGQSAGSAGTGNAGTAQAGAAQGGNDGGAGAGGSPAGSSQGGESGTGATSGQGGAGQAGSEQGAGQAGAEQGGAGGAAGGQAGMGQGGLGPPGNPETCAGVPIGPQGCCGLDGNNYFCGVSSKLTDIPSKIVCFTHNFPCSFSIKFNKYACNPLPDPSPPEYPMQCGSLLPNTSGHEIYPPSSPSSKSLQKQHSWLADGSHAGASRCCGADLPSLWK